MIETGLQKLWRFATDIADLDSRVEPAIQVVWKDNRDPMAVPLPPEDGNLPDVRGARTLTVRLAVPNPKDHGRMTVRLKWDAEDDKVDVAISMAYPSVRLRQPAPDAAEQIVTAFARCMAAISRALHPGTKTPDMLDGKDEDEP